MNTAQKLVDEFEHLPARAQEEVFDFISFLRERDLRKEKEEWSLFSLEAAFKDMDPNSEVFYTEGDLVEKW